MANYYDTPQAAQPKNSSQPLMKQNFLTLKGYVEKDHSVITGAGTHKQVTLPVLGAIPATAANELALYSKTVGAATQLYMVRGEAPATEVAVSGLNVTLGAQGYTVFPGGLKMAWGRTNTVAGGLTITLAVVLPAGWPGFTAIPNYQITMGPTGDNSQPTVTLKTIGAASFITASSVSGINFSWLAIGI